MLDAQIDRKLDRLLQAVGGETGAMQIGETVVSSHFSMPAMP